MSIETARSTRWTLRARLILGIVALLTAASIIVGVVSVFALRGFLLDRLDAQLVSASGRTQQAVGGTGGEAPAPPPTAGSLRFGVQGPRTVTGIIVDGDARAGVVTDDGNVELLDAAQTQILLGITPDLKPVSVDLGGTLGAYRFAADEVAPGLTLLTGLPLADVNATVERLIVIVAAIALVALAAAAAAGLWVVRLALRPLDRVAATAAHVSELPLDRGDVALAVRVPAADADPRTEVGRVGAAINRMLGHIASALTARQNSENRMRQFVADASHELRTPLASIRGYAELTRRSGHHLPDDVVHSLGRVESEAVRMTSLVEDLLLLARLDEGRELERRPIDLTRLLIDAVGDAHAAGPDHEWRLELPDNPVTVDGDQGRLHQVFANLLTNARVHTPAGCTVTVRLHETADSVVATVADDGPGIDEERLPKLFERFARGDDSRARTTGSTGLGLAIVRAVVEGHGGTVTVARHDKNTVFTVELRRN